MAPWSRLTARAGAYNRNAAAWQPGVFAPAGPWYHPPMLHLNDLTLRLGGRLLFDGATVAIPAGHKVGLVGPNGSGKTTLLRLIAGDLQPDGGAIRVRKGARIGTVAQEAPDGPEALIDVVLAADAERAALLAEAEHATDPARVAEIHTRLADIGAQAAPARAAAVLAGLGFDEAAQARACAAYSGGWRMRVALAAALFARPDLLLLDEPTNHLDLEAALWLEGYLAAWPGTLIVVSHDRDLLNRVAAEIVHLEDRRLVRYAGNYDRFERTRREHLVRQARMRDVQQRERRRIEAFVTRFRAKATKARQAQSRLKRLARMEPVAAVVEQPTTAFAFPEPEPLAPPLITLEGASVGYGDGPPVLRGLDLRLDADDRVALLGANGNGKSTLVRLLAGRLAPAAGQQRRSSRLRVGYFAQHQVDELDPGASAYAHLARALDTLPESKVRAHLGAFGLGGTRADTAAADLSGGEKARLLLALATVRAPHLLLLDEPTNHLDVDSREALVQALNDFEGAVVLVSHDAHLIDLVCDRLWLVADGTCRPFDGDLAEYRARLLESRAQARRRDGAAGGRRQVRRERAAARAEVAPLRQAARQAERRLDALHRDKAALEAALADPAAYEGPAERLTDLHMRLAETDRSLAEAEEAWLAAHEALEAAR